MTVADVELKYPLHVGDVVVALGVFSLGCCSCGVEDVKDVEDVAEDAVELKMLYGSLGSRSCRVHTASSARFTSLTTGYDRVLG